MPLRTVVALALALLVLPVLPTFAQDTSEPETEAPAPLPLGWSYFTPQEGGFRIGVPSTPERSQQVADNGALTTAYMIEEESSGYGVFITESGEELDPVAIATLFEQFETTVPASFGGTLVAKLERELGGVPALRLEMEMEDGVLINTIVVAGSRIIQLITFNEDAAIPLTLDREFFGSFMLTDDVATRSPLQVLLDQTGMNYSEAGPPYRLTLFFEPEVEQDSTEVPLGPDKGGERSHLVFIDRGFDEELGADYYGSFAFVYSSPEKPPVELMQAALSHDSSDDLSSFGMQQTEDENGTMLWQIYFQTVSPTSITAEGLTEMLWRVASVADALEAQFVPGDEW